MSIHTIHGENRPSCVISAHDLSRVPPEGFKKGDLTFAAWVWAYNHERDDAVGDLARDARDAVVAGHWPWAAGRKELRSYLRDWSACDGALAAVDQAWADRKAQVL